MPRRLERIDRILLVAIGSLWLVCFALHVRQIVTTGLAVPPVFVSPGQGLDAYPEVAGTRPETFVGDTGLQLGDRLLRVGNTDLRGTGYIGFYAATLAEADAAASVPVDLERAGRRAVVELPLSRHPYPWFRVPGLLAIVASCVIVLLRAPPSSRARLFFAAFMGLAILETPFDGGPPLQTFAAQVIFYLVGGATVILVLRWSLLFPGEIPPSRRIAPRWAWIAGGLWWAIHGAFFVRGPVPAAALPAIAFGVDVLIALACLGALTWNYRHAGPIGRRQVKWILLGAYVGSVMSIAYVLVTLLDVQNQWLDEAVILVALTFPAMAVGVLIGVIGHNLFDVDRVFSATTAYGILLWATVVGGLLVVPGLAAGLANATGMPQAGAQILVALAFAAVLVPSERAVRPRIDRFFFRERDALKRGIGTLLHELSACETEAAAFARAGERLDALLSPESCVLYGRDGEHYTPMFARAATPPPMIAAGSPLVVVLERHKSPLVRERRNGGDGTAADPFDLAALETIGAAVVVPVRHRALLRGFICLGAKRSGDVYTFTDSALLAAVGDKLSVELSRCEEEAARVPLAMRRDADAHRAGAEEAMPGAGDAPLPAARPFVGRQRELTVLRGALDEARADRGRLVLLTGESGAGKTRLAEEFLLAARLSGAQVAWGACREGVGVRAFHPWMQILRAFVRGLDTADLSRLASAAGPMLANVIPTIRERLPDLPAAPPIDSEEARFRLFDSVGRFLDGLGAGGPMVVVLDDLHEADRSSLLLLQFLVHDLRQMRLVIVATYRAVAFGGDDPLAETFAEVVREPGTEWVEMRGLGDAEVAELIGAYTGAPPPAALAAAVRRQTEGSPLFVVEFVRVLQAEGRLAHAQPTADWESIPREVRTLIRRRLGLLSKSCRDVLSVAATARRALPMDVLAAAIGDGKAPAAEPIAASVREAVSAGILIEVADVPRRYRFAHALIRDTVYEEVDEAQKAALHRRVASALEREGVSEDELAELAQHWFAAIAAGGVDAAGVDKTVDYARRAAQQAVAMLAYEAGARLYRMALAALERANDADQQRRAALWLALGEALRCAGDVPAARAAFTEAAALARALGEAELLARAAIGCAGRYVEVGSVDEPLCRLLEEALRGLPATDSALQVRIMARLAAELTYSKDGRRIAELCEQALAMAQRVRDPAAWADAFNASQLAGAGLRDPHERLAVASEIVRLAEKAVDRESAVEMIGWRVAYLLELGDMRAAEAEVARHARLAESLRDPVYTWLAAMFRAMRALHDGRFADAEELAGVALAQGQRAHNPNAQQAYAGQLFFLRRAQGRLGELRLPLAALAAQYPDMPTWRIALASLHVETDELQEARALFDPLAERDFAGIPTDPAWLLGMALLAEVAAALGDTPRAATLYALLLPYANRNVSVTGGAVSVGPVTRYLGLLARAMGREGDAERHLDSALALATRWQARPIAARIQCELAELLVKRSRPGDSARAAELLRASQAAAQEMGMAKLAEQVAARLRVVPDEPPPAPDDTHRPGARIESAPTAGNGSGNALRREGEYWTVRYRGSVCRLRDRAGMRHLAALLERPHEEVPALTLAAGPEVPAAGTMTAVEPGALRGGWPDDLGEVLDGRARAEYRERLRDLAAEIETAEQAHDSGLVEQLRYESERLREALGAALGLGGRARRAGSAAERARVRVTRALREAIDRIRALDGGLGEHLARSVRTGTYCCYAPPEPTTWSLMDEPAVVATTGGGGEGAEPTS